MQDRLPKLRLQPHLAPKVTSVPSWHQGPSRWKLPQLGREKVRLTTWIFCKRNLNKELATQDNALFQSVLGGWHPQEKGIEMVLDLAACSPEKQAVFNVLSEWLGTHRTRPGSAHQWTVMMTTIPSKWQAKPLNSSTSEIREVWRRLTPRHTKYLRPHGSSHWG